MNQLMNNSEGSTCVDGGIRLLWQLWDVQTLPSLQRGEGGGRGDKKGKRKQRQILYWKRITKEEVQFLEEKYATVTTLSLLPLSSIFSPSQPIFFFFFGDYCTIHLPVETAATRCYDPNTAVWCDDWLRGRAGVGGVVQHIHSRTSAEAPLKFKH